VQKGQSEFYRGVPMDVTLLPKVKVEVVVSRVPKSARIARGPRATPRPAETCRFAPTARVASRTAGIGGGETSLLRTSKPALSTWL